MEVNLKKTKIMIFQKHNSKKQNLNLNFTIGNKPVDITNEYTYLGLKITPNAKFSVATKHLSEKAMHALYKIRKNVDFHCLPANLACKIFHQFYFIIRKYGEHT
jgi:hypothetical protein